MKKVISSYDGIKTSANLTALNLGVFFARLQFIFHIDILKLGICIFLTKHTLLLMYVK